MGFAPNVLDLLPEVDHEGQQLIDSPRHVVPGRNVGRHELEPGAADAQQELYFREPEA